METVTSEIRVEVRGPLRDAHINPKAHYLDYFAKAWTPEKTQKKNDIRGNCDRRDKIQFHGPFVTIHPRRTYSPSPKVGWGGWGGYDLTRLRKRLN